MKLRGPDDRPGASSGSLSASLCRATLGALMSAEVLGVALLRGPRRVHVLANARYLAITGRDAILGAPIEQVWPASCAPSEVLDGVSKTGQPAVLHDRPSRPHDARFVTFTYHSVESGSDLLLVLAQDVTEAVVARQRAALLQALVDDLLAHADPISAIASSLKRTRSAIGAKDASLFVVDEEQALLRGAPGDWDWTRTSFTSPLGAWPTVMAALESDTPRWLTAASASGAEAGWFEANGTNATLCVPLSHGDRRLGLLFFDFTADAPPDAAASLFVGDVAKRCALALDRVVHDAAEPSAPPSVDGQGGVWRSSER